MPNHGTPRDAFVEPSSGSTTTTGRSARALYPALLRQHREPRREEPIEARPVGIEIDRVLTVPQPRRPPHGVRPQHFGDGVGHVEERLEGVTMPGVDHFRGR